MVTRPFVTFRFRLPLVLMLAAQPGLWPRSPRGGEILVDRDGSVLVRSFDRSETYAREQVLRLARAFLREVDDKTACIEIPAMLYPSNGDNPIRYSIALNAKIAITPTLTQAALIEGEQAPANAAGLAAS